MTTILLLGAGGSAAANVLDSLRRSGRDYRVVGADASNEMLHLSSADVRVTVPRADERGYGAALRCAVSDHSCDIVHAQSDLEVRALGRCRDAIGARTYLPGNETLETAADKHAFAARMEGAGIAVPESAAFASVTDVIQVTTEMLDRHERVWLRARVGAGARASLPVRTAAQAASWVSWWIDEKDMTAPDFMACEMLPGREFAYQSVWDDGQLVAGQTRERLDYLYGHLTPSGQTSTPAVARTVHELAVDDLAQRAIRALDPRPRGVYCVDIKESSGGQPKVTEINAGRFFTTSNFFAAAGLNMPDMAMRLALDEHPEPRGSSPLEPDLYWIRMVDMGYVIVPGDELDPWQRYNGQ